MTTPTSQAPTAVRITTVIAVVVVALIAAIVSYAHMQQLADHAGESWRSWLLPISVDGLIVAASMVLLTRHRAGLPGGVLAWGSLVTGVVASLAANMADARPEVTSVLVAGWAPVAFAATFHLLLQQRRAERAPTQAAQPSGSGSPPAQMPAVLPARDGLDLFVPPPRVGPIDVPQAGPIVPPKPAREPARAPARRQPARTSPSSKRAGAAGRTDEQLVQAARDLAGRSDGPLTQYAVRQAFGLGSARAARLLEQLDPVPAGPARSNGRAQLKEVK